MNTEKHQNVYLKKPRSSVCQYSNTYCVFIIFLKHLIIIRKNTIYNLKGERFVIIDLNLAVYYINKKERRE